MTIVTNIYEAAHGRKPRPSQDSVWSFLITRRPGEATPFQTSGTYREAARDHRDGLTPVTPPKQEQTK